LSNGSLQTFSLFVVVFKAQSCYYENDDALKDVLLLKLRVLTEYLTREAHTQHHSNYENRVANIRQIHQELVPQFIEEVTRSPPLIARAVVYTMTRTISCAGVTLDGVSPITDMERYLSLPLLQPYLERDSRNSSIMVQDLLEWGAFENVVRVSGDVLLSIALKFRDGETLMYFIRLGCRVTHENDTVSWIRNSSLNEFEKVEFVQLVTPGVVMDLKFLARCSVRKHFDEEYRRKVFGGTTLLDFLNYDHN